MKALDLFCGAAGGWHLGFQRAGIEVVAGCEADPWRRAVYTQLYGVPVYPDIRTLTARQVFEDHGTIDILCGSPPCQDASTANANGKGVAGARTGLFFDALRLAAGLRPSWILLENVPGLRTRGYDRIDACLEMLGYERRALVVGAVHAGAPHRRKRVVVVANLPGVGRGSRGAGRSDPSDARQSEQAFHDADPATVFRNTVAGCEPDRDRARVAAHTVRGRWEATGEFRPGQPDLAGAAHHAAGPRPPVGQDQRRDGGEEQPPALRASLARWDQWNGGPPALGRVDDGVPAKLASRRGLGRACVAAYGDSFVPIFPELLGRFIRNLEAQGLAP